MGDPPTVLLPGTLCTADLWAGVRCPAGSRALPALRGGTLAQAAATVLDAAPPAPFHLIGFSLGATVACEVLRRAPERLARLTLVSASALAPRPEQLETWAAHEREVHAGRFGTLAEGLAAGAGPHHARVLDMALTLGPEVYLEQLALLRSRPDSRADLAACRLPLTLLVGAEDRVTPPALSEALAAQRPRTSLRVVPGAGHYLPLDAPEALGAALLTGGATYA